MRFLSIWNQSRTVLSDAAFGEAMMRVLNVDKTTLMHMGEKLHDNINRKCDWTAICNGLVNNVYDNRGVKSEINK